MDSGEKISSLMFGIQWDLVLKYLEQSGVSTIELKTNSGSWGNYRDSEFAVAEGNKYVICTNYNLGNNWSDIPAKYTKTKYNTSGNGVLLSTGAVKRNSKMNIYDLAGNLSEWTLEKSHNNSSPCSHRGGIYYSEIVSNPSYCRKISSTSDSTNHIGFRLALY